MARPATAVACSAIQCDRGGGPQPKSDGCALSCPTHNPMDIIKYTLVEPVLKVLCVSYRLGVVVAVEGKFSNDKFAAKTSQLRISNFAPDFWFPPSIVPLNSAIRTSKDTDARDGGRLETYAVYPRVRMRNTQLAR